MCLTTAPAPNCSDAGPRSDDDYLTLATFLRSGTGFSDERWRRWCADIMDQRRLSPAMLLDWWRSVIEFDPILGQRAATLVDVPPSTVIVAGSGKETFKTFNVSTAAAILAAAAGTPVVKGVSRSVSAVSGAVDVLDVLGAPTVRHAGEITPTLERYGIAFVPYPVFCPAYAARYDGVFDVISPASFFMPVAALGVRAAGFVFGLADRDVALSVHALGLIRPDLADGVVVGTELTAGETVDESATVGTVNMARRASGGITAATGWYGPVPAEWRNAVAHRANHRDNAAMVVRSLTAGESNACTELVEHNAALIVGVGNAGFTPAEALGRVRDARASGRAIRLLRDLSNLCNRGA